MSTHATETNLERLDRFGRCQVFGPNRDEALQTQRELLHPNFEIVEAPSLPYGGTYRGPEGWVQLLEDFAAAWAHARVTPLWTLGKADGNRFAKMYRVSGVSTKTGKAFDTEVFELWEFEDGKIIRCTPYYYDTKLLADLHEA
jgi:uncharacterized protein